MAVLFTSDRKMSDVSSQTLVYSDADVKRKLAEFGFEFASLQYSSVYTLLHACAARARDRRAYESSKLTRAELDKLKSSIHSQNAEISEAAKKRRVVVLEELRRLGEQQQQQSREWAAAVKEHGLMRKSKPCESDADFDQLGHMCEAWYEYLLQGERERVGLCVANLVDAVSLAAADLEATQAAQREVTGFSKVVAATNTLETQRKAAVAEAERAAKSFIASATPVSASTSAPAPLDPFGELEVDAAAASLSLDAAPALTSPESIRLTTAQVAHQRYAAQERLRAHEGHVTQRLPLGAGAHCLGRVGTVCFVGPTVLGDGVWVGLRLTVPHRLPVPLVHCPSLALPGDIMPDVRALLRCPAEHALFAPEHTVFPADARDRSRLRSSARQHAAATVIQRAFRRLAARKQAVLRRVELAAGPGQRCAADAMASAAGGSWSDVNSLAQHLLSTPGCQSATVRARLAYTWMATHLRFDWSSEALDADAVLQEGGGSAAGLADAYVELCSAMGVDCCAVRGVGRGCGSDWRVDVGPRRENHTWNVVRGDGEEPGRVSGGSEGPRFMLVDVTYGMGAWGAFSHLRRPTPAWFDVPADTFAQSHYPLAVRGGRRSFPELQAFMQTPTRTLTHLQPAPRPVTLGRYDVEAALVPAASMAHFGARLLHPAPAPALAVPVDRAFTCLAVLLRAGVDVAASLSSLASPYTPSSATQTQTKLLSRTHTYTHVGYIPAHAPSHRIALVTVVIPRRGAYALSLHAAAPSTLPAPSFPSLALFTLTIHASTGVASYRSPHDVAVGFPRAAPLPRHRARPALLAPLTGVVDAGRPLAVTLLSTKPPAPASASAPAPPQADIDDVVVVCGPRWASAAQLHTTAAQWAQRSGGAAPADGSAPVTVFRAQLPPRNGTLQGFQVLARYRGHTDYTLVYAFHGETLPTSTPSPAPSALVPAPAPPPTLHWTPRGRAFASGARVLSASTTAACVVLCVQTHAHTALQAVVLRGTHTHDAPKQATHAPGDGAAAGASVAAGQVKGKVSVRLVALNVAASARTLARASGDEDAVAAVSSGASGALLHAVADAAQVQRVLDEGDGPVTWQVCADVPAGDASVLLYTAGSVNGVYACVASYTTRVPEK
jgi:hypothetical protein